MSKFDQTMHAHMPRAKAFAAVISRHVVALNILAFALVVAFAALYIVQVNAVVSQGYTARDLETRIQDLTERNRALELAVSQVRTLDHVEQSMKILGFVPAGQPTYLSSAVPAVAFAP